MPRKLNISDFPALLKAQKDYDAIPEEEKAAMQQKKEEEFAAWARQRHREEQMKNMMRKSGLGEKFLKRTFETFEVSDENKHAYEYFRDFAQRFDEQKKGIYLSGGYGAGKTHLAAAAANYLLNRGRKVLFLPVTALKERVYASYKDHTTPEIIQEVCGNELLILDDFDKLSSTDNLRELLYGIINRLYEQEKLLIITANVNRKQLGRIYDGSIASRIAEMCLCCKLDGRDRRETM